MSNVDYRARFSGPVGGKKLILDEFKATERLSVPFTIEVDCVSLDGPVDFVSLLGAGVGLELGSGDLHVDRAFHGVLYEVEALGRAQKEYPYRLTLRPWLWLLSLGQNMRIFEQMSVQDIIKSIFNQAGFSNFEFRTTTSGTDPREYCVQFKESDFDFVSRLMEEEGIYYFFEHTPNKHTMVLCDAPSAHNAFSHTIEVARGDTVMMMAPHLTAWNRYVQPSIVKATLQDSHFRKFGLSLEAKAEEPASSHQLPKAEFYDYPGGYAYFHDDGSLPGTRYARMRLDEMRADRDTMYGEGNVFGVAVGSKITVKEELELSQTTSDHLVVEVVHSFGGQQHAAGDGQGQFADIKLEAVPAATHWRPPRVTEKPIANGPQIARVVGIGDKVIDVDEHGRIRVHFDWDRGKNENKDPDSKTCWIRVSQGWADNGFGAMHIPRVGEEVIVDFLDGDPDRPIITGRVYNTEKHKTPYPLPAEKTKSTWKSKSVGSSGSYEESEEKPADPGYNELRFEDKGGSEEFYIHAQRVFNSLIRLDETRKTGRDTIVRVGRDRKVNIKKDETLTIETGDETRKIQQGKRTTEVQMDDSLTVKAGNYSMKVSAGQATFEAAMKITLKCGQSTIVMTPASIEIKSPIVKVTAETLLQTKSGAISKHEAGALMVIKGAMTMIN